MSVKQSNSKEYFRMLSIIYYALFAGQIFFGIAAYLMATKEGFIPCDTFSKSTLGILVAIVILLGISGGGFIFDKKIPKIRKNKDLKSKMSEYQTAIFIRLAFTEGTAFFSIAVYLLFAYDLLPIESAILIGYFIFLKPTAEKTIFDLKLNNEEKTKLNDPNEIIAETEVKNSFN